MTTTTAAQAAPATTWALTQLRTIPRRPGGSTGPMHSIHGRGVLLALAALADEALNSPNGYRGHSPAEVGRITGMAAATAADWLRALEYGTLAFEVTPRLWRITGEAFV